MFSSGYFLEFASYLVPSSILLTYISAFAGVCTKRKYTLKGTKRGIGL